MRASSIGWLLIVTTVALYAGCGDDDDGGDTPAAAGKGGSTGGRGGEAGSGPTGDAGSGGSGESGAPGGSPGGQGGGESTVDGGGGAGGQPMEPVEITIASDQAGPTGIALDDDFVYWANQDAGTIVRCPLPGCGADDPTEIVSGQDGVTGIAVDDTSVYWMRTPELDNMWHVRKCPLSGCVGEPEVLAEMVYGNAHDNDVHVDGDLLYYAAWPSFGTCPIDGCLASDLVDWGAAPAVSIDTDADYIYVAKYGFGEIHRCSKPDCTDNVVLVTETVPFSVAVDETSLYFAAYDAFDFTAAADPHEIYRCPLAGCDIADAELIQGGDISPYAIAVNDTRLFYTDVVSGDVVSVMKSAP